MKFYSLKYIWIIFYYQSLFYNPTSIGNEIMLQKFKTKGDVHVKNKLRKNYCDQVICHCVICIYIYTCISVLKIYMALWKFLALAPSSFWGTCFAWWPFTFPDLWCKFSERWTRICNSVDFLPSPPSFPLGPPHFSSRKPILLNKSSLDSKAYWTCSQCWEC